MALPCVLLQVKVIAFLEVAFTISLLALNIKILVHVYSDTKSNEKRDSSSSPQVTRDSEIATSTFIRITYLVIELVLAIWLNVCAYNVQYNGLFLWFIITLVMTIVSRCYFIGGIFWGQYFTVTIIIFCVNLFLTVYSLAAVLLLMQHLRSHSNASRKNSQHELVSRQNSSNNGCTDEFIMKELVLDVTHTLKPHETQATQENPFNSVGPVALSEGDSKGKRKCQLGPIDFDI